MPRDFRQERIGLLSMDVRRRGRIITTPLWQYASCRCFLAFSVFIIHVVSRDS
jgi:hypothetical protein